LLLAVINKMAAAGAIACAHWVSKATSYIQSEVDLATTLAPLLKSICLKHALVAVHVGNL